MAKQISTNRLYQLPPDVTIVSSSENILLNRIDLHVKLPHQERICPNCGSHSCVIKDSGRERTVRHLPVSNRSTFITYRSRRFFCKDCRTSYFEPVDWIHDSLRMTTALAVDICLELTGMKSIHDIAQKEIVTDETVSAVFRLVSFDRPAQLPKVLCVDEFKGDSGDWNPSRNRWDTHKFQCNITDGTAGVLIDILPVTRGDYLVDYFRLWSPEERSRVKFFCCDMHSGFVSVAKKCFPYATICIDLFHVVKRLNDAMDAIRRRSQTALTSEAAGKQTLADTETDMAGKEAILAERARILENYRMLKNSAYLLKTKEASKEKLWGAGSYSRRQERLGQALEMFPDVHEMYDRLQEFLIIISTSSYSVQRADFAAWLSRALASDVPEIRSAASTLRHWRGYIQNGWRYSHTNGPCEGINNKIKILKRISYGVHDFENFRKRLLLVCGPVQLDRLPAVMFQRKLSENRGEIQL